MINAGILILLLGALMGESENLTIPMILIAIGSALIFIGNRRDADETIEETSETLH